MEDTPQVLPPLTGYSEEALIAADRAYDADKDRRAEALYERDLTAQQQFLAVTDQLKGWK